MATNGQGALARAADEPMRLQKSEAAFRTISEVAEDLDVAQHVLRFWESKFPQVRPLKRGGGRRYYRPEDVGLLRQIRSLLYDEGYTIKGAQKLLRVKRARPVDAAAPEPPTAPPKPATPTLVAAAPASTPIDVPAGVRGELVRLRANLVGLRERLRQAALADEAG